jgi:predicted nuclease with TOPRIM domain
MSDEDRIATEIEDYHTVLYTLMEDMEPSHAQTVAITALHRLGAALHHARGVAEMLEQHPETATALSENERIITERDELRARNSQLQRELERRESGVYGDMRNELSAEVERLQGWLDRLEDAPNPYAIQDILNEYRRTLLHRPLGGMR